MNPYDIFTTEQLLKALDEANKSFDQYVSHGALHMARVKHKDARDIEIELINRGVGEMKAGVFVSVSA